MKQKKRVRITRIIQSRKRIITIAEKCEKLMRFSRNNVRWMAIDANEYQIQFVYNRERNKLCKYFHYLCISTINLKNLVYRLSFYIFNHWQNT